MSTARDASGAEAGGNHRDVTRRTALGAGGALVALMAAGDRSGVAAQSATPQAAAQGVPAEPQFEWIGTLAAQLGEPIPIGETPRGTRLIVPATSGTLDGPNLTATILSPTADWLLVRPDDVGELDVRGILQTDDGALVYLTHRGYATRVFELLPRWQQGEAIPPEEHYFVVTLFFETGAAQYDWLQRTVTVGLGSLVPGGVSYEIYAVSYGTFAHSLRP